MKRIQLIASILTIFMLTFTSCEKTWLEPDPLSFFAPENVFISKEGFESGLVTCKKEINAENHGYIHFIAADHAFSDICTPIWESDFTKNTPSGVGKEMPVLRFFTTTYRFIKNANTLISRVDEVEWNDESIRNKALSEALWFRAYWYYRLVNTYGDIPWVGEEVKDARLDYNSTSRSAILEKLQEDLEFAAQWLPVNPAKLGDVSKGAANHLLTKVYLARGEFDKAIQSATAVINGPYALMTERFGVDASNGWHNVMWDLHRIENKNLSSNTETIYATVDRPEAAPETWYDQTGTYATRYYSPAYWRILDATGTRATNWNTPAGDTLGIGNANCRPTYRFNYSIWEDANYSWEDTPDLRRSDSNWIEMGEEESEILVDREASPQYGQPLTRSMIGVPNDTILQWFSWPLYKTYVPTPNTSIPWGGQGDMYIFRLAETYLLRAEAYFWKGQLGLAAEDINVVRARSNASLVTASEINIDYIFDERARELYTEEPRHSEMVRVSFIMAELGLNGYSLSTISDKNWYYDRVIAYNPSYSEPRLFYGGATATLEPHNMLWPIPQSVITANTLGRINQNIGYDGDHLNVPPLETIP